MPVDNFSFWGCDLMVRRSAYDAKVAELEQANQTIHFEEVLDVLAKELRAAMPTGFALVEYPRTFYPNTTVTGAVTDRLHCYIVEKISGFELTAEMDFSRTDAKYPQGLTQQLWQKVEYLREHATAVLSSARSGDVPEE